MMYYVYLIQSQNRPDKLYLGSTNDLRRRLKQHNGNKSLFTARYSPWKLIYYEAFLSQKDARVRESKLKNHGKGMYELKKRLEDSLRG
ncbi:MAG: GIY-YIG nuclease family protein [Candidatus Paceibacterota bacterium]